MFRIRTVWIMTFLILSTVFAIDQGFASGGKKSAEVVPIGMTLYGFCLEDSTCQNVLIESGSRIVMVTLGWHKREGGFTTSGDLDRYEKFIDRMAANGIEVIMQLKVGQARFRSERHLASEAPGDWNLYGEWIRMVAGRFRGKIRAYIFEGEVYGDHRWLSPLGDYFKLVETAGAIIREGDPRAKICHAGIATGVISEQHVRDLLASGEDQEALRVFRKILDLYHGDQPAMMAKKISTTGELRKYMRRSVPVFRRRCEFMDLLLKKEGLFDLLEIHCYNDSPEAIEFAVGMMDRILKRRGNRSNLILKISPYHDQKDRSEVDYDLVAKRNVEILKAAARGPRIDSIIHYTFAHEVTGLVERRSPFEKKPAFHVFREFMKSR